MCRFQRSLVCNLLYFQVMRVLIAEDNKAVAGTFAAMLDLSHHTVVEIVGSGLEAIHAYQRHRPDIVIMDYLMTGLNGVTACRNILAKDPAAKIILVSGALDPDQLSLVHSGARAILRKPVPPEELQHLLDTLNSEPRTEIGTETGESPPDPSGSGRRPLSSGF
jgi:two-component system chemotaxis response regulator CheY